MGVAAQFMRGWFGWLEGLAGWAHLRLRARRPQLLEGLALEDGRRRRVRQLAGLAPPDLLLKDLLQVARQVGDRAHAL
eukprot:3266147-Prymnesium_polylepis.1